MTPAREARRQRMQADPTIQPHGKPNTYREWGCRCGECTDANTVAERTRTTGRPDLISEEERFWSRITKTSSCWPMEGATAYGQVKFRGKIERAHRVAWILARGPIPDGLHVLHRCDNPPCARPSHLFLGTQAENMRDMREKGRSNLGSRNGRSVLTEAAISDARERWKLGERQSDIASSLGVATSTLSMALSGRTWRHVAGVVA